MKYCAFACLGVLATRKHDDVNSFGNLGQCGKFLDSGGAEATSDMWIVFEGLQEKLWEPRPR